MLPRPCWVADRKLVRRIVRCTEEVARELYIGAEECEYMVAERPFKALVGFGTFMLKAGIVLLGNSSWTLQAALGCSYILLNALYWGAALLPPSWSWDLEAYYNVQIMKTDPMDSFTEALWIAIKATKSTDWVKNIRAAPESAPWRNWLNSAHQNVETDDWDPKAEWDKALVDTQAESGLTKGDEIVEIGKTEEEVAHMNMNLRKEAI